MTSSILTFSVFKGGFFPAPNPIDFSKVFNVSLADNPVAFATVMAILGLYIILAIWARREDLKDVEKVNGLEWFISVYLSLPWFILLFQRMTLKRGYESTVTTIDSNRH